ncbi:MAG TPA: thioredoxin domain-containing protein [Candidatus Acidoferrales bacterium]|nr:thioredoxin domain-containing protein [Candidatus Acidoferrales bacterium]
MELKNRLGENESPYLREASGQPVHWQVYSDEIFKLAEQLDRPILLDIGAVWCHWCHVMDRESYSDPVVAEIINKHFVPVKVDRDQMPDVDSRYQTAIGALAGAGGWPLTGFLTFDGKAFYGGTYFPKDDTHGRQGLLKLLPQIAELYATRRTDILRSAEEMFHHLKEYELNSAQRGELNEGIIGKIIDDARARFDKSFGGFGGAPKFYNPTALQLLAEEAISRNDPNLKEIVEATLDCIARGGVYDQLGGGFHRYSVDRYWHVPHFEKMLYDSALMLETYLLGLQLSGNVEGSVRGKFYARVARETADWITGRMRAPNGAFYAHQDADVDESDDGTYWTWTKRELEDVLTKEENEVAQLYFDIREMPGDIHEFPERNVLRITLEEKDIVKNSKASEDRILDLIGSARQKLLDSRNRRKPPFVEKTIFADRNGLAIGSLVEASIALKERKYFQAAEEAAAFIMDNMCDVHGNVAHAFSGGAVLYRGLLDDNVLFGNALLDLFEAARNEVHLYAAEKIAQLLLEEFNDGENGGFLDRPIKAEDHDSHMELRKKPIEDAPTPSGNSCAAILFDRLFVVTENRKYFEAADAALKAFAGSAERFGLHAANYARALRLHLGLIRNVR